VISGTVNTRHNWWGTYTPQHSGVADDSWAYRLGSAVGTWGEGSLGGATLTAAGGSGTGIIVSHGRGLANVPFGKGVDPYASAMCSDYYDFFVLSASGNWTVSIPVDAGVSCDNTVATNALYQFALSGTMPDAACIGGACWNVPAGVSATGRQLEATVDAAAMLLGTPFVAGDDTPLSNDPTAVSLSSISATTNNIWGLTAVFSLLMATLILIFWKRRTV